MAFKCFSYTKKNRFDYPAWKVFVTFVIDFSFKQSCDENVQEKFLSLWIYPFTIIFGYRNYYTWGKYKYLTWNEFSMLRRIRVYKC